MASEAEVALASLELLMSEFFAPDTGNQRKREIETMLETFSNRRDSWKHCLIFLQKSENQYVLMFTLTTLENIINRQWIGLSENQKGEIRLTLWNHLIDKHDTVVYFIRNKLASLMVSIARYDWPHLYPDFFSNIVDLLECDGRRTLLGLVLAAAASEELGAPREAGTILPTARRQELTRLMLKGMPQMLQALSGILEKHAQKQNHSNPPPSPTSGVPHSSALPDLLATTRDSDTPDEALNMEIVVKCLTTLQHLFSWLPLSSHVPPSLVTTVFHWGSAASQSRCMEAAVAGLGGVCELLYRRYAPPSSAATALRLHHAALTLLRHLLHHPANVTHAPHQYLSKLAEFLKLFISLHFKRLEAEPEFDAIEFLSYLFQFTFQVPTCDIFENCIDIWTQFLDILKPEDTVKYSDALMALVDGILNKIQFQHNKAQLQHIDNDALNDDGETEWHTFLKHCIECVARVADFAPMRVFSIVMERWQCVAGVHARAAGRAALPGADTERLQAALLDLATLTRALGRLAPALLAEDNSEAYKEGCAAGGALIERVCATLAGLSVTRPHHVPSPHAHALLQVHAEMFACMGAWCCYAGSCGVSGATLQQLYTSAAPFLMPCEPAEPAVLSHAAAHLLLSLSKNVKLTTDPIALLSDLFTQAQRSLQHLEPKTAGAVRSALVCVALPRGAGAGGESAARALLCAWGGALATAGPARALPPLAHLLRDFAAAPTLAKKILCECMMPVAEMSLQMLRQGACRSAEPEMTEFFLALFTSLLQQLGDFAYTAIDVFLEVATRCGGEDGVERLLTCVRLGVEGGCGSGAGAGGVRVAAVLRLLSERALPQLARADTAPPLARSLHRLLASILLHRWRYFFSSKCEYVEDREKMEHLKTILSTIGHSLMEPDIELFRINIETLESLNTRWKLYHRAIFRTQFLSSFLSVALTVLAERRQPLARDETAAAVYAMAAVDFAAFRATFLPHYLLALPGLLPHQAHALAHFPADTDLPTFTQNILSLTNDIYCYRMCNLYLSPENQENQEMG